MKLKYVFWVCFILLIYSCNKEEKEEPQLITQDTIKQFIEFEYDGVSYGFHECDTIKVFPFVTAGFFPVDSVTVYYSSIMIQESKTTNASGNLFFTFYNQFPHKDLSSLNYFIGINEFYKYFQKKWFYFPDKNCSENIHANSVSISCGLLSNHNYIYFNSADECMSLFNKHNNLNSRLKLTNIETYNHARYGKCILVEGKFTIDLVFKKPGNEIMNGRFKLLLNEKAEKMPY